MRRVGIFGGTFDPPHIGHLIAAEEARFALRLDTVLFVPAGTPPHKPGVPMAAARHRVAMVEAAIRGNPAFAVARYDVDRPGPHYTVDMLRLASDALGPRVELYFLMGADSLVDLPNWRDPAGILSRATVVAMSRPGYAPDLASLEALVPGLGAKLVLVEMPLIGIRASELERRAGEGRPIRYQVPDAVIEYVRREGLYRRD
jgi:nicotinate-nucleotide adenylyltransferase